MIRPVDSGGGISIFSPPAFSAETFDLIERIERLSEGERQNLLKKFFSLPLTLPHSFSKIFYQEGIFLIKSYSYS